MDGEEIKYMRIRQVLSSLTGIAEVCIFSGVTSFLKVMVCNPKNGCTLDKAHTCKSQQCMLLGLWDVAEDLRSSDTQLWRQRIFLSAVMQKWSFILQTKQNKTHSPVLIPPATGLATPKIDSLRRYLYTKTIIVTLLTITWFPRFHLCLASE